MTDSTGATAVINAGLFFRATTVITIVGGTIFLMWLGEQITQRGVGNGISLIIFAGIIAELPAALAQTMEMGRTGALPTIAIIGILFLAVIVITAIVFVERSQRRIVVQYPTSAGQQNVWRRSSHLPLKLNTSGVIPPILRVRCCFSRSALLVSPVVEGGMAHDRLRDDRPGPALIPCLVCRLNRVFRVFLYGDRL